MECGAQDERRARKEAEARVATVEAQLRTLEDSKVAEAEKHAQEMRTLESTLNAAHAGKKVSTQQHIAHCMFMDTQTEIWLKSKGNL